MTQNINSQIVATLADFTRPNKMGGVLLALHPDLILVVRLNMTEDEREKAVLSAVEGLSLPVLKDPVDDESNKDETKKLYINA